MIVEAIHGAVECVQLRPSGIVANHQPQADLAGSHPIEPVGQPIDDHRQTPALLLAGSQFLLPDGQYLLDRLLPFRGDALAQNGQGCLVPRRFDVHRRVFTCYPICPNVIL